jgi:hypothetical protein
MAAGTSRIGFEIEFTGLSAPEAARLVRDALGGVIAEETPHKATLEDTPLGRVKFELDTRFASPAKDDPSFLDQALDELELRQAAADILSSVVPVEMITGPLERACFDDLDRAIGALRDAGAQGTYDHPLSAYGLHLNIELDPLDEGRAIRVAAAYAFVEPWLRRVLEVDLLRRVTPFIDPYPRDYVEALGTLFAGGETPRLTAFLRLYAQWNATRNRGLDMWPLLGALNAVAAEIALGAPVKNPRPAFHYRLPDSRLSRPGWTPREEVRRWDAIERIADAPERLARARDACLDFLGWRIMRPGYEAEIAELME